MKNLVKLLFLFIIIGTLSVSCKKNKDPKVAVKLTDAPFPFGMVLRANVGITKVELKDTDGNYHTVYEGNTSVNMVDYTNGETAEVTVSNLPAGTYKEARVSVGDVSIDLEDNRHFDVQSGANHTYNVKISPAVEVSKGDEEDLLFDLDLSNSFSFTSLFGNTFWFNNVADILGINSFNAHFRAVCLSHTGVIEGNVVDANGNGIRHAMVTVKYDYDGDGHKEEVSTICNDNGHYAIIGLPKGTYKVNCKAHNHADVTQDEVNVDVQHSTTVSFTVN